MFPSASRGVFCSAQLAWRWQRQKTALPSRTGSIPSLAGWTECQGYLSLCHACLLGVRRISTKELLRRQARCLYSTKGLKGYIVHVMHHLTLMLFDLPLTSHPLHLGIKLFCLCGHEVTVFCQDLTKKTLFSSNSKWSLVGFLNIRLKRIHRMCAIHQKAGSKL